MVRDTRPYISVSNKRRRAQSRTGWAIIAGVALAFAGLIYGAASIDSAHGVNASSSLQSGGF